MFVGRETLASLGAGVSIRIVTHHFVIEPEFGFSAFSYTVATGFRTDGNVVLGIGVGAAIPIAARLALTPMARATFDFVISGGLATTLLVELPFTIFIGRDKFIEPYAAIGMVIDDGIFGRGIPVFAAAAGCRLGILF